MFNEGQVVQGQYRTRDSTSLEYGKSGPRRRTGVRFKSGLVLHGVLE